MVIENELLIALPAVTNFQGIPMGGNDFESDDGLDEREGTFISDADDEEDDEFGSDLKSDDDKGDDMLGDGEDEDL